MAKAKRTTCEAMADPGRGVALRMLAEELGATHAPVRDCLGCGRSGRGLGCSIDCYGGYRVSGWCSCETHGQEVGGYRAVGLVWQHKFTQAQLNREARMVARGLEQLQISW